MEQAIDTRRGERIIRKDSSILFYKETYSHPELKDLVGFPVIVEVYGYNAIDVYLVERRPGSKCGKGKFLCMIEKGKQND